MALAADQLVAAIKAQLTGLAGSNGVHLKPLSMIDSDDLDCVLIDGISDMLVERVGVWPISEIRKLSCDVIPIVMAPEASALAALHSLHAAAHAALFGTRQAITLGGLINQPLVCETDDFFSDTKSLQQPVCGWTLRISCHYSIRLDRPGTINEG